MARLPESLEKHRKALLPSPVAVPGAAAGVGENPACGDRIELWLAATNGRLACGFSGRGCSAALALASYASAALAGRERDALERFDLRAEVEAMGGLGRTQQHALELVLRALEQARADLARRYPLS